MLRIYFLQQWYNLSDPGAEEALTDSVSMRRFVGIAFTNDRSPDETTICKFRHLLEKHDLGKKMFEDINRYLKVSAIKVAGGTIVNASIIGAPSSSCPSTNDATWLDVFHCRFPIGEANCTTSTWLF